MVDEEGGEGGRRRQQAKGSPGRTTDPAWDGLLEQTDSPQKTAPKRTKSDADTLVHSPSEKLYALKQKMSLQVPAPSLPLPGCDGAVLYCSAPRAVFFSAHTCQPSVDDAEAEGGLQLVLASVMARC